MITSLFSAAVLEKGYNSALRLDKHVNDVTYMTSSSNDHCEKDFVNTAVSLVSHPIYWQNNFSKWFTKLF